jgi:hypothetical protein
MRKGCGSVNVPVVHEVVGGEEQAEEANIVEHRVRDASAPAVRRAPGEDHRRPERIGDDADWYQCQHTTMDGSGQASSLLSAKNASPR